MLVRYVNQKIYNKDIKLVKQDKNKIINTVQLVLTMYKNIHTIKSKTTQNDIIMMNKAERLRHTAAAGRARSNRRSNAGTTEYQYHTIQENYHWTIAEITAKIKTRKPIVVFNTTTPNQVAIVLTIRNAHSNDKADNTIVSVSINETYKITRYSNIVITIKLHIQANNTIMMAPFCATIAHHMTYKLPILINYQSNMDNNTGTAYFVPRGNTNRSSKNHHTNNCNFSDNGMDTHWAKYLVYTQNNKILRKMEANCLEILSLLHNWDNMTYAKVYCQSKDLQCKTNTTFSMTQMNLSQPILHDNYVNFKQ